MYSKDKIDALKTRLDDYDTAWNSCQDEATREDEAEQALSGASAALDQAEQALTEAKAATAEAEKDHGLDSDEYQTAAGNQAQAQGTRDEAFAMKQEVQAARDAQFAAEGTARITLDNIQVDIIGQAQRLQA